MNKTNTLPQKDGPAETLRSSGWLGVLPKPYYADEWVTIYHADSRNLLPMLADYVLITDRPTALTSGQPRAREARMGS